MTKLSALTVCVGRADALRLTLPHNVKQVDELIVVTTEDDVETQRVLGMNTAATTVISDACYANGDTFNLGRMQNEGLRRLAAGADWLVFFCCDVFLNRGLREFVNQGLDPDTLYGTFQHDETAEKADAFRGAPVEKVPTGVRAEPNGYFQLWNRNASSLRRPFPAVMSEAFCSAGGPDTWFAQQWPAEKKVIVPELAVVHILHEDRRIGAGWNNGSAQRSSWRQCAMLTPRGIIQLEAVPPGALRMRLTDTLNGDSVEVEVGEDGAIPETILADDGAGGFIFNGKKIADHHIHLAYWAEVKSSSPARIPVKSTS